MLPYGQSNNIIQQKLSTQSIDLSQDLNQYDNRKRSRSSQNIEKLADSKRKDSQK